MVKEKPSCNDTKATDPQDVFPIPDEEVKKVMRTIYNDNRRRARRLSKLEDMSVVTELFRTDYNFVILELALILKIFDDSNVVAYRKIRYGKEAPVENYTNRAGDPAYICIVGSKKLFGNERMLSISVPVDCIEIFKRLGSNHFKLSKKAFVPSKYYRVDDTLYIKDQFLFADVVIHRFMSAKH